VDDHALFWAGMRLQLPSSEHNGNCLGASALGETAGAGPVRLLELGSTYYRRRTIARQLSTERSATVDGKDQVGRVAGAGAG